MEIKLKHEDQIHFKDWLELNLNSISWEGRFLEDFNTVWDMIFEPNQTIEKQFSSLKAIEDNLIQGPVISWFSWIKSKFVCYVFIYKKHSIREIISISELSSSTISLIIRDFLIDRHPHLEELINIKFQIGNVLSENLDLTFEALTKDLSLSEDIRGSLDNEVLTDLEVTLYSDWGNLKSKLLDAQGYNKNSENLLKDKKFIGRQIKFLQELVFLFIIGGILIFTIKIGNKAYEDYLIEKISLFSPNFFWLDKNISFKVEDFSLKNNLKIQLNEIDALDKLESKKAFDDITATTRFEVESDVVLTSIDTLPKDFTVAGLEQSNYEEVTKGGYRNVRYGRRRAYRVMMTSANPELTKRELVAILKKYKVKQVDNVKPGTEIPGGMYFNLYVPRNALKEFLSKVSSFEKQSTILESKTVFGGPPNTNKVFIWIKSI